MAIELVVLGADGVTLETTVQEVYLPAFDGQAGVLEHHLPYISLLAYGEIAYRDLEGKRHYLYVEGGFVETSENRVSIVSNAVERAEDFDVGVVEKQYAEVEAVIRAAVKGETGADDLAGALKLERRLRIKRAIIEKTAG